MLLDGAKDLTGSRSRPAVVFLFLVCTKSPHGARPCARPEKEKLIMMTSVRGLLALAACLTVLSGCGSSGSSVDVGSDCFTADAGVEATDCGSLKCFCGSDSFPGVCSQACTKQADCAALGDDMSCAKDHCTG